MLLDIILASIPLSLAAFGALFSEYVGYLNIGIEGIMSLAAFTTIVSINLGLPPLLAILLALGGGLILVIAMQWATLKVKANIFIVGIAINLIVMGLVPVLSQMLLSSQGAIVVSQLYQYSPPVVITSWIIILAIIIFLLKKTIFGLSISLVANNPRFFLERRQNLLGYKVIGLTTSGILASLAGSLLALRLGTYVPGVVAGRGWIALVIIYLGDRKTTGLLLASMVFAISDVLISRIQGLVAHPGYLLGIPFFLSLLSLILVKYIAKKRTKAI